MGALNTIRRDTAQRHRHKYANRNPVHRSVLNRFFDAVAREVRIIQPTETLEFGCGEGLFLQRLRERDVSFARLCGIDLRSEALDYARALHSDYEFVCVDLLSWDHPRGSFDLVIASEVLEHLPRPESFLRRLVYFSSRHLLLTVPWEPWFRIMNLLRGRDIWRLGNHPEHVNRWSFAGFMRFLSPYVEITRAYTVFPFIIVVARISTHSASRAADDVSPADLPSTSDPETPRLRARGRDVL